MLDERPRHKLTVNPGCAAGTGVSGPQHRSGEVAMPHWTVWMMLSLAGMGTFGCGGGDPGAEPGGAAAKGFSGSGWVPADHAWATIEHVSDTGDCQGVVPSQVAGPVQMAVPVTPMTPPP